ncbi:MAG: hypothetical protein AB1416_13430 [Actinomycetota bacterium]
MTIRRALLTFLAAVAVLGAVPAVALSSAQEVIADYKDDGQVQGCYSSRDFERAIEELDPNEAIYEQSRDILRQAQARCLAEAGDDGGGSGAGLWIGIAAGIGVVAVGTGILARRRGD